MAGPDPGDGCRGTDARDAKRRGPVALFIRRYPNIAIGGFLVSIIVGIAIFAPVLGTIDPTALSPIQRTQPPSETFWFGTDMLGRDVYSRVLYGAQTSISVGFVSVALSAAVALTVLAGCGPLLWLVASQLLRAGATLVLTDKQRERRPVPYGGLPCSIN